MSSSTIFVPSLNIQQQQEQEDCYNLQRFIQLLQSLTQRSILYYCPYDQSTLKDFYHQILLREQTSVMSMQVMHQFISELKQRNRSQLNKQNQYYQQIMRQQLQNGINTMSKKQFRKIVDRYQGEVPIITQILIQNSKNADFIGCELVLQLLKQVNIQIQDAVIPQLSITKLKTLRLDRNQQHSNQSIIMPIFQQIGQYQIKKIVQQCFRVFNRKINLYKQFISDQQILQDAEQFQGQLVQFQEELTEEIHQMINTNNQLTNRCEEFNQMYLSFKDQEHLQIEIAQKLKQQIEELKEELNNSQAKISHLQQIGNQLEAAVKQAQEQLGNTSKYCEQIQQQLREYKQNYKEIYEQYQKLVEVSNKKSMIHRQEQNKKIFATRSIKEQLDDTAHKLNKILAERQKQRKMFTEKQENNTNHINLLQAKVEELEIQLKQKNQYLSDYMKESKLLLNSKSAFRISAIIPKDNRKSNNPQLAQQNLNRQSVTSNYSRIQTKSNKFSKAAIGVLQPIEQDQSDLEQLSKIYQQQNILKVIKEDNQSISSHSFKKQKTEQSKHQKYKQSQKYDCFFSKATIINIYGKKFQTMILLTNKRFCYFDTKGRLQKYIPLQKIKQFAFNIDNPNTFIIKPQRDTSKQHITNDMIFSTRNISKFEQTIHDLRINGAIKVNITVKKAENTWLKVAPNEYNLKMSIPHNNNPFRLSLSTQNVFYAHVREQGIFTSKVQAIIIIQPIGILCFQGDQTYQLQVNRSFICFLPIVEDMKVTDKKNSKEAPQKKLIIEYTAKGSEFSYGIIFSSKQDIKRFKKVMENELKIHQQAKLKLKEKLLKMFPS